MPEIPVAGRLCRGSPEHQVDRGRQHHRDRVHRADPFRARPGDPELLTSYLDFTASTAASTSSISPDSRRRRTITWRTRSSRSSTTAAPSST